MHILDRLWSERKSLDYKGVNYKPEGLISAARCPGTSRAAQRGRSPRGREFAAKHCDIAFCSAHNPRALKKDRPACCFVRFWGKAEISKRMTIPFEMSSLSQRSHDNERQASNQTSNRDGHRSSRSVQSSRSTRAWHGRTAAGCCARTAV